MTELAKHLPHERVETLLSALEQVEAYAGPVAVTREAEYSRWVRAFLTEFVEDPEDQDALLAAIDVLVDQSPSRKATS